MTNWKELSLSDIQKKVKNNKDKQKELKKWLDWACSSPDVKNVWIKNKINNKFYNIKGEDKCLSQLQ